MYARGIKSNKNMFRKLVSNLAYSPALVGQLSFYAKRLKKEEATRRLGLIFTALALVLQSFAVFSPPEAVNAASANDFIYGGVTSKKQYLAHYDSNKNNLKSIFTALGITRAEIAGTTENKYIKSTDKNYLSWGHHSRFSYAQGERKYAIPLPPKGETKTNVYARPMKNYGTYTAKVMVGYSKKVGWFALMYDCGNLVTLKYPPLQKCPTGTVGTYPYCTTPEPKKCALNPSLPENSPECKPCPGDKTLWYKDEQCVANVTQSKSVKNITQGNIDATTETARASDKLLYTLRVENTGNAPTDVTIVEEVDDVLEYATIVDTGGATYDKEAQTLTWPAMTLKEGEEQSRLFTVQVLSKIPAMGTGVSDRASYDCTMINTFGNSVEVDVTCPVEKEVVEQTVKELPHTGPAENMLVSSIAVAVITYFYARSRQVKKEVRLIRRDLNAGTI